VRLVAAAEMRELDRIAIQELGIPGMVLMERAARAVAEAALELATPQGRIELVCGGGNNGGDGYLAARLLQAGGRVVRAIALVPREKLTGDARRAREQAEHESVAIEDRPETIELQAGPGDVVIDAIFGTGLARPPEGRFAQAIAAIAVARRRGARVVAVDLPSGLSADTGRPLGPCVSADRTVTFAFSKRGLAVHPGLELAGAVTLAEIGIPPEAAQRVPYTCNLLTESEARALVPARAAEAHKGDAGRLLVVAGSPGKTGAAHLSLSGALRGGAGLVTLAARPETLPSALAGRPEAMSQALPGAGPLGLADLDALVAAAQGVDALVIGPGIPRGPETGRLLRALLEQAKVPAVLDADALNALAEEPGGVGGLPVPVILTPHPGEMARLTGSDLGAVQEDRIGLALAKAEAWGATLVLKGARTVVAHPGAPAAVIPTGNPGMATGGTGDVLAGLIGALLAGGLDPFAAARAGAWVHGRAGDLAAQRLGQRGLLAGDLADAIGAVWAEWER
jgi:NAD(P)H-hydrate epimerase